MKGINIKGKNYIIQWNPNELIITTIGKSPQ